MFFVLFTADNCRRYKPAVEPPEPTESTGPVQTREGPQNTEPEQTVEPEQTAEEEQPVVEKKFEVETIEETEVKSPERTKTIKPGITKTPAIAKEEITDRIKNGITGISRGFGYTGDIEVPESFKNRVAHYIRYFTYNEKGARFYQRAMRRSSKYLPMIRKVLKKKQLPLSLAYLPVIESGFNPYARSHAGAVGMWQFMRGTARMYGLKVTRRTDERKNPVKATHAAAEYLNDLLAMFGMEDPFLGISAYNAGEGKIMRSLRKISYKEHSFWTLVKKNLLRTETDEYIPRLIAVVLMAHEPGKYAAASKITPVEPNDEEDQEIINTLHTTPREDLDNGEKKETPEKIEEIKLEEVKKVKPRPVKTKPAARTYRVKRGDNLYRIAKTFNVKVKTLKKWNRLRNNRIYPGQKLKIYGTPGKAARGSSSRGYQLVYTVNYTDSLARIALFFRGVSARDIMRWNRLRRSRIYPKQKLKLYLDQRPRKVFTHVVKRGETARKIAAKYRLRIEYVLSLNGMVTDSRLKPGKRLKIYLF